MPRYGTLRPPPRPKTQTRRPPPRPKTQPKTQQLEAELQESAWLLSDVDSALVFSTPPERMWEASIRRLGADPAALQGSRGVH